MVNQSPREHSSAPGERFDARPDGHVVRLLDAAAAPAEPGPQPGEELALAAFRASHRTRRISMFSNPTRARAAVAATIGAGTLLFSGVGGAAAGVLPDPAQNAASTVLTGLGLDVPRADDRAGTDEATEVETDETSDVEVDDDATEQTDEAATESVETEEGDTEEAADPAGTDANEHGKAVSGVATSTPGGSDKGATVSEVASEGKSKAGEDHGKPEQPGAQGKSHKPAADDAAEDTDAADKGSQTAGEKSGGHSHAGSKKTRP